MDRIPLLRWNRCTSAVGWRESADREIHDLGLGSGPFLIIARVQDGMPGIYWNLAGGKEKKNQGYSNCIGWLEVMTW